MNAYALVKSLAISIVSKFSSKARQYCKQDKQDVSRNSGVIQLLGVRSSNRYLVDLILCGELLCQKILTSDYSQVGEAGAAVCFSTLLMGALHM